MKSLIASLLLVAPAVAMAATPAPAHKTAAGKVTASAKKTTAIKKTAPAKKTAATSASSRKTTVAKAGSAVVAGAGVGAVGLAAARTLGPDELALAERVHTGRIGCELGQHVNVVKDEKNPGHFLVSGNGFNFHMTPIGTSTGVVRLEDQQAGAVWLQIANKSMLMNQKQGKRLADECMSPEQLQVAAAIKKTPPPSLLETPGK